jgi:hypothetical protein
MLPWLTLLAPALALASDTDPERDFLRRSVFEIEGDYEKAVQIHKLNAILNARISTLGLPPEEAGLRWMFLVVLCDQTDDQWHSSLLGLDPLATPELKLILKDIHGLFNALQGYFKDKAPYSPVMYYLDISNEGIEVMRRDKYTNIQVIAPSPGGSFWKDRGQILRHLPIPVPLHKLPWKKNIAFGTNIADSSVKTVVGAKQFGDPDPSSHHWSDSWGCPIEIFGTLHWITLEQNLSVYKRLFDHLFPNCDLEIGFIADREVREETGFKWIRSTRIQGYPFRVSESVDQQAPVELRLFDFWNVTARKDILGFEFGTVTQCGPDSGDEARALTDPTGENTLLTCARCGLTVVALPVQRYQDLPHHIRGAVSMSPMIREINTMIAEKLGLSVGELPEYRTTTIPGLPGRWILFFTHAS